MWLITTTGFYTVVQHKDTKQLMVRTRVKKDLVDLKKKYMPELSKIEFHEDYDYPYRAMISHEAYGAGLVKIANDIDYDNFKNAVHDRQGTKRSNIYMSIWSKLMNLEVDPNRRKKYWARQNKAFDLYKGDESDEDIDKWLNTYHTRSNTSKL